ncbi:MAG: protoheme IX farnesyltransferase [Verrucomicrobiae bacterium]|nr:protoheme IX farnesyltransferase [Verrucomicrobiae bacterium]
MSAVSVATGSGGASPARAISDWLELTKVRLTCMVVMTAGVGFILGSGAGVSWVGLAWALGGIGCVAAGAAVLNQCMERELDALMERTRYRPLPAGRTSPKSAMIGGLVIAALGLGILAARTRPLAAFLAAASLGIYLLCYTPMKRWSTLNTLVGAVPGALPPVLGWAAAAGELTPMAWLPFWIMLLWQVPHFFAIAWICREDYARAGFWMLPVVDPLGWGTGGWCVICSAGLVPAGVLAMWMGMAGAGFAVAAGVAGWVFVHLAWRFACRRGDGEARALFLYSLCYLPFVLLGLAVADRL